MQAITDHADFAQALAEMRGAHQVVDELRAERERLLARARESASQAERLEAADALARLDHQIQIAQYRADEAAHRVERLRLDARQELAAAWVPRVRDAARALEQALLAAATANDELVRVIEEFRAAGGDDRFAQVPWPELRRETPRCGTRLDSWRRGGLENGWL